MSYTMSLSDDDLQGYLNRIGVDDYQLTGYPLLETLHLAHVKNIVFENIDVILKQNISVELQSVYKKLVVNKRGGYCFEQNILFAAVLAKLGFNIDMLAARVVYHTSRERPRTHMLLRVNMAERSWLVDVGFGASGILAPVLMRHEKITEQFLKKYMIVENMGRWHLRLLEDEKWVDLYTFSLEPQTIVDYEMANHYTSTHPDSKFTQKLTIQTQSEHGQLLLIDTLLSELKGGRVIKNTDIPRDNFAETLVSKLNLELEEAKMQGLIDRLYG